MRITENLSKVMTRYKEETIRKGRGCGLCLIFCPAKTGRTRFPAPRRPEDPSIMARMPTRWDSFPASNPVEYCQEGLS